MNIPGLGAMTKDPEGWYRGRAVAVPVLGGEACYVLVDGYDDDPAREDFHAAIAAFLSIDRSVLEAAAPPIFEYYRDIASEYAHDELPVIAGPGEVLAHIYPGDEVVVARDSFGDRHVYVSVECECDWEPEHGLQIVFRDGRTVTKVGPYDGHLTNASACARDDLADVVYLGSR